MGAPVGRSTGDADARAVRPLDVSFGLFPPLDAARAQGTEGAVQGVCGQGEGGFGGMAGAGGFTAWEMISFQIGLLVDEDLKTDFLRSEHLAISCCIVYSIENLPPHIVRNSVGLLSTCTER